MQANESGIVFLPVDQTRMDFIENANRAFSILMTIPGTLNHVAVCCVLLLFSNIFENISVQQFKWYQNPRLSQMYSFQNQEVRNHLKLERLQNRCDNVVE